MVKLSEENFRTFEVARKDVFGNTIKKNSKNHKVSFGDNLKVQEKAPQTKFIEVHKVESLKEHNFKNTHKPAEVEIEFEREGDSCCCNLF